jgi:threonylcarbamoyladenosine tRNA methylthiotransferase MtaB
VSGPEVITLGCRLNIAESEAMRTLAAGEDDLVIVNSCAVTQSAMRQTRQAIRRAKRARPDARILVTGCGAQVDPTAFGDMPEVWRVVGNTHKASKDSFVPSEVEGRTPEDGPKDILVSDIMQLRQTAPHLAASFADHTRAFVEVQNGCDHRCTFCIIPYGRGNSRSVPAGAVVDRIKALVDDGAQEVVLTGVDLTSYGPDLPGAPTLGLLVERILAKVPSLPRLRLSSIDSVEIDDRLLDLITGEPRMMPHLHLSLQSGDDMILKRMKRRHSSADAIAIVDRIRARRPEVAIGADLIAGFPTETDAMAENSLRLIKYVDAIFAHVFPFSPRKGTPAARMPQVDPLIARRRAERLRAASAERRGAWLQRMVGTTHKVLVERGGRGHAENFVTVRVPEGAASTGKIKEIMITSTDGETLAGVPA